MTSDFDYKKYSLENLEKWVEDALNSAEASPQEIYDCIRKVVEENYYCYKNQTSRCYELLALLNGNGKGHIPAYDEYLEKKENLVCDKEDPSPECKKSWSSFWEEIYYPEEYKGSSVSSVQYTDAELNAMCDKAVSDEEKNKCREYNLREAEYYNKRAELDAKQDKAKKWVIPVEADGLSGEYYVQFPDDLLEAANIKEGDAVEWIDQGDGSYMLKKVNKYPSWVDGNQLSKTKTYDEMIAEGWSMTDDGFWIKE
jgi:bifunctional DNA-binding transcriptional regulator/antitoxin component of YhaV-PrlF toxin-antitoxin module